MSTPPRINRVPVCPPAPRRPIPPPQPPTTPIVIMQIDMRQHGLHDEQVNDEDDENEWMRHNLYFTSREAMERYIEYLYKRGDGCGFEDAIILHIQENSTLNEFLEKISTMKASWQLNKNLSIYIYNNIVHN